MKPNRLLMALFTFAGLAISLPSQAVIKWDVASAGTCTSSPNCSSYGNTRQYSGDAAGAPTVTASAWSNTVGSTNLTLADAYLATYPSLGVKNRDEVASAGSIANVTSPNHSMDNESTVDSILFSFTDAIKLSQVDIGWSQNDSDISVLAYIGAGPAPSLAGKKYSDLTAVGGGWQLIGNYANLASTANKATINAGGISSSYWLISAYNSALCTAGVNCLDSTKDYVKLSAISGDKNVPPSQVPEPATLVLFGAGLLGLARARKQ